MITLSGLVMMMNVSELPKGQYEGLLIRGEKKPVKTLARRK